ncbi:hypothetical protein IQ07DRAFT_596630 [Pyrenochaeta sp. DS3sAY3a]|nr:hypothetical protein IQ07DRAFT_596630 [Pyrenochaeta sp. DS3sAY3a]
MTAVSHDRLEENEKETHRLTSAYIENDRNHIETDLESPQTSLLKDKVFLLPMYSMRIRAIFPHGKSCSRGGTALDFDHMDKSSYRKEVFTSFPVYSNVFALSQALFQQPPYFEGQERGFSKREKSHFKELAVDKCVAILARAILAASEQIVGYFNRVFLKHFEITGEQVTLEFFKHPLWAIWGDGEGLPFDDISMESHWLPRLEPFDQVMGALTLEHKTERVPQICGTIIDNEDYPKMMKKELKKRRQQRLHDFGEDTDENDNVPPKSSKRKGKGVDVNDESLFEMVPERVADPGTPPAPEPKPKKKPSTPKLKPSKGSPSKKDQRLTSLRRILIVTVVGVLHL